LPISIKAWQRSRHSREQLERGSLSLRAVNTDFGPGMLRMPSRNGASHMHRHYGKHCHRACLVQE
jgi:hypothetical protein